MSAQVLGLLHDARRAVREGPAGIERRQRARLAALVAFARAHSPYYRALYRDLPPQVETSSCLPITRKPDLLAHFDGWVTDRAVTLGQVQAFLDQPGLIGQPFRDTLLVATTSGTTGTRGVFLSDRQALRVRDALLARALLPTLTPGVVGRLVGGGGRTAAVLATGGHFAGLAGAMGTARRSTRVRVFSVHRPLPELVAGLNAFRPAVLTGYASVLALLADEQAAGRLRLRPGLVLLAAEGLAAGEDERIARIFGATVRNVYASTECLHLAVSCEHGWLHVNGDWALLEPVDAAYRPVPPGEASHTVLLSNLANRAQPILRYDLGDSVLVRPDPCPCGNPLPAVRVRGRAADTLRFPDGSGGLITLAPLALASLIDRTPGVALFQLVQTASDTLHVRLRPAAGADPGRVWEAVRAELAHLLGAHGLGHVTLERAQEMPQQSSGGKYRTVIPLGHA